MERRQTSGRSVILSLLVLTATVSSGPAGEATPETTNAPAAPAVEAQLILRSNLQLQEQLHAAQLAIERVREEAEVAARRNTEAVAAQLKLIEESLTRQRERELQATQSAHRLIISLAAAFAGVALLALLGTSWLQLRAVNRMAEVAAHLAPPYALGLAAAPPALAPGDVSPEPSSPRLPGVIDRLENRIRELERAARPPALGEPSAVPGSSRSSHAEIAAERTATTGSNGDSGAGGKGDQRSVLLGKGQALLNLDQPDQALACFDQALAAGPDDPEALVKKGTALERLKRFEEAIACYDRALAGDRTLTVAYLYKGGACNALERFDEALRCYEDALRTQESREARRSG